MIKIEVFPTSNLIFIILKINLAHFVFQSRATVCILLSLRIVASKCEPLLLSAAIVTMAKIIAVSVSTMLSNKTGNPYKCYALITEENEVIYANQSSFILPLTLKGVRNFDDTNDVIDHLIGMQVEKEGDKVIVED